MISRPNIPLGVPQTSARCSAWSRYSVDKTETLHFKNSGTDGEEGKQVRSYGARSE